MIKLVNVSIAFLIIAVLVGCGSAGADAVKLSASDAGTTVHVKEGQTFRVALAGNPSTGYTWDVAPGSGDQVARQGDPQFKADSNAHGAGGVVTLRFAAVKQGSGPLKMIYHRSFEPYVPPLDSFEVIVVVD